MRIRSELTKLLVFVVIAGLFGILLVQVLSRSRVGPSESYAAVLANASGLEEGDLVRVAGVEVGQVDSVEIGAGNQVKVGFHLAKGQSVTDATRLFVRYENLLGDRYVELSQEAGAGTDLRPGAVIPLERTSPALDLDVLLNGFKPLFAGLEPQQVNELATSIVDTLQGRAGTVEQLLERTGSLTNTIADRDASIGNLVDSLNVVLGTLDRNDSQLRGTVTHLQRLVSGLARDRNPIGQAVVGINRMTISLTDLLAAVRPSIKTDLQRSRLVAAIVNRNEGELRSLLEDIPRALQILSRVGSHGAFFNFYLCGVRLRVSGPNGPVDLPGMTANNHSRRCKPLEDAR
jgi:phospholipid/cholesterol/gamma-HCH transport system substrate-binding protein